MGYATAALIDDNDEDAAIAASVGFAFILPLWYFGKEEDSARSDAVHKYNKLLGK